MTGQCRRRAVLRASVVASLATLAGCASTEDGSDDEVTTDERETAEGEATDTAPGDASVTHTETATETTAEPTATVEPDPVQVTGRLVDESGAPVTVGQAIALGEPEGLTAVAPDERGRFEMRLTAGTEYAFQYTQGVDGYPDDDLPDLFTIGDHRPTDDLDMGDIVIPRAYDVDVTVRDGAAEVSEDANVRVIHVGADGDQTSFELRQDVIELTGEVRFRADYRGQSAGRRVTVTGPASVTLDLS